MKTDDNDKIEFNKLQGVDVLDKLPEEKIMNTYNDQFYSSLSNMKFISCSIPDDNQLFYRFEKNDNANTSTNTTQILKSFQDLFIENQSVKKIFRRTRNEIVSLANSYENFDSTIIDMITPDISKMEDYLKVFLVKQKTENFKLIKEIGLLEREKNQLESEIYIALERLNKLEQDVGIIKKRQSVAQENKIGTMNDNELSSGFNVVNSSKV